MAKQSKSKQADLSVLFPSGVIPEVAETVKWTVCRSAFNAGVYGMRHAFGSGGAMSPAESAALINAIGADAKTLIGKLAPVAAPNQRLFSVTAGYKVIPPAPIKASMRLSAAEVEDRNHKASLAYTQAVNGVQGKARKARV